MRRSLSLKRGRGVGERASLPPGTANTSAEDVSSACGGGGGGAGDRVGEGEVEGDVAAVPPAHLREEQPLRATRHKGAAAVKYADDDSEEKEEEEDGAEEEGEEAIVTAKRQGARKVRRRACGPGGTLASPSPPESRSLGDASYHATASGASLAAAHTQADTPQAPRSGILRFFGKALKAEPAPDVPGRDKVLALAPSGRLTASGAGQCPVQLGAADALASTGSGSGPCGSYPLAAPAAESVQGSTAGQWHYRFDIMGDRGLPIDLEEGEDGAVDLTLLGTPADEPVSEPAGTSGGCSAAVPAGPAWLRTVLGREREGVAVGEEGHRAVRQSAYTLHLASMLKQVVLGGDGPSPTIHSTRAGAGEGGGYPWLFSASEVRMVTQFLALPTAAQGLYARLLNRKGPWFRTQDFVKYSKELLGYRMPGTDTGEEGAASSSTRTSSDSETEAAAREATKVLLDAGLLTPLPATTTHDNLPSVLQAVHLCLRAPELRLVAAALAPSSTPATSLGSTGVLSSGTARWRSATAPGRMGAPTPVASSGWSRSTTALGSSGGLGGGGPGSVDQLRAAISAAATGQRTMFGGVLNVARAVRDAVLQHLMDGAPGATGRGRGPMSTSGSKGVGHSRHGCAAGDGVTPSGLPPLVRVASPWVALFRRAHRLFYLACSTGAASSGSGSGGADVLSTAPTRHYGQRSGNKEHQEGPDLRVFSVWSSPGLMAIWRKVSFAPITLNRSCVVFPTAPHWTAYELGLILLEELESCSGQLVPSHSRVGSLRTARSPGADLDAGGEEGEEEGAGEEGEGDSPQAHTPFAHQGRGPSLSPSASAGPPAPVIPTLPSKPQVVATTAGYRTIASAVFGLELAPILDKLCAPRGLDPSSTVPQAVDTIGVLAYSGFRDLLTAVGHQLHPSPSEFCDDDVMLVEDSNDSGGDVVEICPGDGPAPAVPAAARQCTVAFGSRPCTPVIRRSNDEPNGMLPRPVAVAWRASFCLAAAGVVDGNPSPSGRVEQLEAEQGRAEHAVSRRSAPVTVIQRDCSSTGAGSGGATAPNDKVSQIHPDSSPTGRAPFMTLVRGIGLPPFLCQFSGGYVCATAAWLCVDVLERNRYYVEAIGMILQLLGTPYTPHRRGRWWLRLSLDYAHIAMPVEACAACMDAVEDAAVPPGDRIALQRRMVRLQRHHGIAASAYRSRRRRHSSGDAASPTTPASTASPSPLHATPMESRPSCDWDGRGPDRGAPQAAHIPPFADTIKALTMSVCHTTPSAAESSRSNLNRWIPGTHRTVTIAGNPMNKVTGARSVFLGADKGSGGATVLKASSVAPSLDSAAEDAWIRTGRNVTLRICRSVYPDKFPTPGLHPQAPVAKSSGHTAVGEVEEAVDEEEGGGTDFEGAVGSDGDGVEEGGGPSDPLLFVEEHALQHYEENGGWRGLHCEGSPIITLFGILMWDLLFLPLPDVFLTQFQDGPLDLDFPQCFYPARQRELKARLAAIATMSPSALVADIGRVWRAHQGQACRGVSWTFPLQFLQLLAVCLGGPALAHLCDALCWNHKHFTGGLPDLLLWRVIAPPSPATGRVREPQQCGDGPAEPASPGDAPGGDGEIARADALLGLGAGHGGKEDGSWDGSGDGDGDGMGGRVGGDATLDLPLIPHALYQARFVEVKGPRDRLSDRQRAWLALLNDAGIDTDVCFVKETV